MHILYLHQHFALPSGTTGTRSYEFARRWVKAGHQVTLICGVTDQSGMKSNRKMTELNVEGIRVLALNTQYSNTMGFASRVAAFLRFMGQSFWAGLKVKNVDIMYATSTPLTISIPAILLKWFKRIPFVFEVRDQWPEVPIEMGCITNPILKRMLLRLEKSAYRNAAAVVALSPGMSQGVRDVLKGADKTVVTVPNSSDTDLFSPTVDGRRFREEMKWNGKCVVLHFGAVSRANGLCFLLEAAERLRSLPAVHFVIIGEGRQKNSLRAQAAELKLANVQILDSVPKYRMPEVVAACDISTVIFADYPILEHNSANKFFDSLAAGKPVLLNYSGWQRSLIEEYRCGCGCKQGDLEEYVSRLMYLYNHREQLGEMGQNARKLAEQEFGRDMLAGRALSVIESVVS